MITVIETHETFASTIDTNYGRALMTGYEYYSRLQRIPSNPSLCPESLYSSVAASRSGTSAPASSPLLDTKNYSIIVPSDQLPVALLVSSHRHPDNFNSSSNKSATDNDDCTLMEKIQYALTHIEPIGRVKFLIVESSSSSSSSLATAAEDEKESIGIYSNDDMIVMDGPATTTTTSDKEVNKVQRPGILGLQHSAREAFEGLRHHLHHRHHHHKKTTPEEDQENHKSHTDIPLYIIHVSKLTYTELHDIIQRQTDSTVLEGGTQISIDDNRHSHRYYGGGNNEQNETLLYTALIAFITAGVCFFIILLCGSNDWDDDDAAAAAANAANHPPRPTRQRLTKEQVRQLFPIYRYDGQSKLYRIISVPIPVPSPDVADTAVTDTATTSDTLQQPLLSTSSTCTTENTTTTTTVRHRNQQEVIDNMTLDVCSICLDEYEIHDKIRILPCHHTFHSKCVGRWLSERSAVCPLCKENLYIEPEPVDSSETDDENANTAVDASTTTASNSNTNNSENSVATGESTIIFSSVNNMWRRLMEHMAMPPTTAERPSTTSTTNTELLNINTTTADVEMSNVTPTVESTVTTIETEPIATAATTTSNRISSSWWSRMFPQTSSTSVLPSNTNSNSLTEPLLQPLEHEDIEANSNSLTEPLLQQLEQQNMEATSIQVDESTVLATSASECTTRTPLSSTSPVTSTVDDTVTDDVVLEVPTEESDLSSAVEPQP
jgi:hypothetical protein